MPIHIASLQQSGMNVVQLHRGRSLFNCLEEICIGETEKTCVEFFLHAIHHTEYLACIFFFI